jgi:hypothetical protein
VNNSLGLSSVWMTKIAMISEERKSKTINEKDFIICGGEEQRHGGAYPTGVNYIAKEERRLAPLPEGYRGKAGPLLRRVLGVGAVDVGGGEDPHRGLQHPQLEAEDEMVADAEAVAEGKGPPAPGEDGIAARSEDDVNRPEELWPALLHQHDLSGRSAGGIDYPPNCVRQPEGDEALGVDGDDKLQEVGPRSNEGSQHLCCQAAGHRDHSSRRRGHLLWPRIICGRGKGAQSGLHLLDHPINAPQGAGSRRRWRRRVQSASRHWTPKGQGTGGPWGGAVHHSLHRRPDA